MSFGKLVALGMLGAFSVGAGGSYYVERHGIPTAYSQESKPKGVTSETVSSSVQVVKTTPPPNTSASFRQYSLCSGSIRVHCVVDGDTLWHNGTKIRVADIDTPEVGDPKCASEAALGAKATRRLLQLVNAGPFKMQAWPGRDEDKYGRKLRVLVRDGRSLGDILVSEGLARTWTGRRQPWC
jgi:endonuclease YncB( thermonuclease family)